MIQFEWVATYNDGSKLRQFDNGIEHLFSEINIEQLKILTVINGEYKYKVNLVKGAIIVNDIKIVKNCIGNLVCFRKVKVYFGKDIKIKDRSCEFHLGIGDKKIIISNDNTYKCIGFNPINEEED